MCIRDSFYIKQGKYGAKPQNPPHATCGCQHMQQQKGHRDPGPRQHKCPHIFPPTGGKKRNAAKQRMQKKTPCQQLPEHRLIQLPRELHRGTDFPADACQQEQKPCASRKTRPSGTGDGGPGIGGGDQIYKNAAVNAGSDELAGSHHLIPQRQDEQKEAEQAKRNEFRQGASGKIKTKGRQHLRGKGRRQRLQRIRNARMINAKPQGRPAQHQRRKKDVYKRQPRWLPPLNTPAAPAV